MAAMRAATAASWPIGRRRLWAVSYGGRDLNHSSKQTLTQNAANACFEPTLPFFCAAANVRKRDWSWCPSQLWAQFTKCCALHERPLTSERQKPCAMDSVLNEVFDSASRGGFEMCTKNRLLYRHDVALLGKKPGIQPRKLSFKIVIKTFGV
jgi:hypothetical protein